MIFRNLGRATVLALFTLMINLQSVAAHSLPGSSLVFWQETTHLNLSITLPLEDLIITNPSLEHLSGLPSDGDLSEQNLNLIRTYFTDHLGLRQNQSDLPLTFNSASIQIDENAHVGQFKLLSILVTSPLTAHQQAIPTYLSYDAVMHEVRNHRATVYVGAPDTTPKRLTSFGFQDASKEAHEILVQNP